MLHGRAEAASRNASAVKDTAGVISKKRSAASSIYTEWNIKVGRGQVLEQF